MSSQASHEHLLGKHGSALLASLSWVALSLACVEVPPETTPPESTRKATAWVDNEGREIRGGRLELIIPPGALAYGDRVQITIDEIADTPQGHLGDSYLVGPSDLNFLLPVTLRYRYSQNMVQNMIVENLFIGRAEGLGWSPVEEILHDSEQQVVEGESQQLGVFGLAYESIADLPDVDAGNDAGNNSSNTGDDGGNDTNNSGDAGNSTGGDGGNNNQNNNGDAGTPPNASSGDPALTVELIWNSGADLDLHLLQEGGSAFTESDCYWGNCSNPLDWAPSGQLNNPQLLIDDTDGYGPEQTAIDSLNNGVYLVGAHLYATHGSTTAQNFSLRVYDHGQIQGEYTWSLNGCDQLLMPLRVRVSGGVIASVEFTDAAPSLPGRASSSCQ